MEQFTNGGDQQGGDRNQRNQRGRGRGRGRDSNNNNRRGDHQQQQQQQQAPMMFPPGAMPMFFAPGPNGQPQPFFPQQQQQMFPFSQQPGFPPHMAQAQQQQQQQPPQLPSKPSESGLCKYATECKNAYCKFAHPSPAASKESGLVLSDETCEKQISCEDAVRFFTFVLLCVQKKHTKTHGVPSHRTVPSHMSHRNRRTLLHPALLKKPSKLLSLSLSPTL